MLDNFSEFEKLNEEEELSSWVESCADCFTPKSRAEKAVRNEDTNFVFTSAVLADDPVQAALAILGKATIKQDGTKITATLREKTYLTISQPGLKQLFFAKDIKMTVDIGDDTIKISAIKGIQGRPPFSPKIGGWISLHEINVDRDTARITCGKLGARFTVKIPLEAGAFAEIKAKLKEYNIR